MLMRGTSSSRLVVALSALVVSTMPCIFRGGHAPLKKLSLSLTKLCRVSAWTFTVLQSEPYDGIVAAGWVLFGLNGTEE
jgi:hypothetical protein